MPQAPASSSTLGYLGILALVVGFFLVLAGFGVINIEKISVARGPKTWVFGIILILGGIGFLLPDILKEFSQSATTLTPTITVVSSVPTATAIPPTKTPRPTPIPTATIDADPTVYDNFNNPTFDGGWNIGLWEPNDADDCKIAQQEGFLSFSCTASNKNSDFNARRLSNMTLNDFGFIEAKLMLDRKSQADQGNIAVGLMTSTDNLFWGIDCTILGNTKDNLARTFCWIYPAEKGLEGPTLNYNTWHTIKIEVNPESTELNVFVDGQQFGNYIPPEADKLKQAKFYVKLAAGMAKGTLVAGYFDDVRIGK